MVVGSCSKGAGRGRGPSWLQQLLERTVLTGDAMVGPGLSEHPPPWGSLSRAKRGHVLTTTTTFSLAVAQEEQKLTGP